MLIDYDQFYQKYDDGFIANSSTKKQTESDKQQIQLKPAIECFMLNRYGSNAVDSETSVSKQMDGFKRMEQCRVALDALDACGWKRSYFQRKFHDAFLAATTRAFFKLDPPGSFQKSFQAILEINGWDNLNQEILISTPRRFGKTISVSMFCAALLYSCAGVEVSIYATCKRISQKLLRNIVTFLNLIYKGLGQAPMKVIRGSFVSPIVTVLSVCLVTLLRHDR